MPNVELQYFAGKGTSVHAIRDLAPGEEVLTFEGKPAPVRGMHTLQIGPLKHLDVFPPGKYVNHSCSPNCGIKGQSTLVAMKPILKGEEITFDYVMTEWELSSPFNCLCGTKLCRGQVLGYKDSPEEVKIRYKGFVSEYLLLPPL